MRGRGLDRCVGGAVGGEGESYGGTSMGWLGIRGIGFREWWRRIGRLGEAGEVVFDEWWRSGHGEACC